MNEILIFLNALIFCCFHQHHDSDGKAGNGGPPETDPDPGGSSS